MLNIKAEDLRFKWTFSTQGKGRDAEYVIHIDVNYKDDPIDMPRRIMGDIRIPFNVLVKLSHRERKKTALKRMALERFSVDIAELNGTGPFADTVPDESLLSMREAMRRDEKPQA